MRDSHNATQEKTSVELPQERKQAFLSHSSLQKSINKYSGIRRLSDTLKAVLFQLVMKGFRVELNPNPIFFPCVHGL